MEQPRLLRAGIGDCVLERGLECIVAAAVETTQRAIEGGRAFDDTAIGKLGHQPRALIVEHRIEPAPSTREQRLLDVPSLGAEIIAKPAHRCG